MIFQKLSDEERKERKARNASYGQLERRLLKNEPLKGKTLALALDLAGNGISGDKYLDPIANKLKMGERLTEYEIHIMVDVILKQAKWA